MTEFWEVGVTNKAELEKKLSEEAMSLVNTFHMIFVDNLKRNIRFNEETLKFSFDSQYDFFKIMKKINIAFKEELARKGIKNVMKQENYETLSTSDKVKMYLANSSEEELLEHFESLEGKND